MQISTAPTTEPVSSRLSPVACRGLADTTQTSSGTTLWSNP